MARHALLIGVSEFTDERLARLNAPTNDVIALRGILQDSSRGNFDSVELSLNEDFLAVRDHISVFFHDRAPDDVLLLYYSGHGILGRGNRLFLSTSGSNLDTPRARSVSSQEIRDFIEESRAQRQIVVLDCCHSGVFAEHAKSAAPAPAVTPNTFSSGDAGLYVLTAADTLQFAWDGAELRTGNEASAGFSRFTSWLVEGLEKGEAAPDDEQITMDALYHYLLRRARSAGAAATPQRIAQGGVGDLVISANPLMGFSQIDPEIRAALVAQEYRTRMGAVAELTLQMDEIHTVAARAARRLLQRHLQRERDFQVRRAITRALEEGSNRPSEEARQEQEEQRRAEAARQEQEEQRRAEAARQEQEEQRRAEAARQEQEEQRRAEAARQEQEEQRRAEAARQEQEEQRRAEAARRAEAEKQRAAAARQAEAEKQRTEATQRAEEEQRRVEAARQLEDEKRCAEAAREIAKQFTKLSSVYVEPQIPRKKIANAMAAAQVPADQTVYILFDYTIWGSAKDCLVATQIGIYYNNQFAIRTLFSISYGKLRDVRVVDKGNGVVIDKCHMAFGRGNIDASRKFLRSLQNRLRAISR